MPWYFSCKSHWFCGLVQIHPQDVVVFILNTATESGWLSPWDPPLQWGKVRKRIYRPATHPIHFAAISPDKIHRYAAWAVFFFYGKRTLKISWAVWTWYCATTSHFPWASQTTPLHKQGQELRSEQTAINIHEQRNSLLIFCVLTIRKHLLKMRFERSGRGQEPSRGHKFSILENLVFHRDFTSQTLASFPSDLVGACLPQTLLIIRALRHEWNGVSCFT